MKRRGTMSHAKIITDLGPVQMASAPGGMNADGFWTQDSAMNLIPPGITRVTKTHTTRRCEGNMPWDENTLQPLGQWPPDCIRVDPDKKIALNAVGLSGPGIEHILENGTLCKIPDTWVLSWMPTPGFDAIKDAKEFVRTMKQKLSNMKVLPILQVNLSCPNTSHDPEEVIGQARKILEIVSELRLIIQAKFSIASASVEAVFALVQTGLIHGIVVSNTIPYDWMGKDGRGFGPGYLRGLGMSFGHHYWGDKVSPLSHLVSNGGGVSGVPLLDYVPTWIKEYRRLDKETHITACGGIMNPVGVRIYDQAGANSVSIATTGLIDSTRTPLIIKEAQRLLG